MDMELRFSRPGNLADILADWGLTIEDRRDCIVDAGNTFQAFQNLMMGMPNSSFTAHSHGALTMD